MSDHPENRKPMTAGERASDRNEAPPARRSFFIELLHQAGLMSAPGCFRDYRFLLAIFASMVVLWLIHDALPPFSKDFEFHWKFWLALVIWQPIIEELLFRGILQGQLVRTSWGKRSWLHISAANLVASVLFVGLHMIKNPPLFAAAVFVPSLLFGYFRDRCNSVYPSILLHAAFNALVIDGLLIHGNMIMP